jgi:hypothetical protein
MIQMVPRKAEEGPIPLLYRAQRERSEGSSGRRAAGWMIHGTPLKVEGRAQGSVQLLRGDVVHLADPLAQPAR